MASVDGSAISSAYSSYNEKVEHDETSSHTPTPRARFLEDNDYDEKLDIADPLKDIALAPDASEELDVGGFSASPSRESIRFPPHYAYSSPRPDRSSPAGFVAPANKVAATAFKSLWDCSDFSEGPAWATQDGGGDGMRENKPDDKLRMEHETERTANGAAK